VTLVGSAELAALAESALSGNDVSDADIAASSPPASSATVAGYCPYRHVVLACTHIRLLLDRLIKLAPWPVDWIDPAPRSRGASSICSAAPARIRSGRRDGVHVKTTAYADPGIDAVFRWAGAGVADGGGLCLRLDAPYELERDNDAEVVGNGRC